MGNPKHFLEQLQSRHLTVATAESLTGGLLCSELVAVPGASRTVLGGVVSYATAVKIDVLGVPADLVAKYGVVSAECAASMAERIRTHLGADVGVSTTGVAGPESQDGQPVGTVFVGLSVGNTTMTQRFEFAGDRQQIRTAAVTQAVRYASSALSARLESE